MTQRARRDKSTSQIVFGVPEEKTIFLTMALQTIPNRPRLVRCAQDNFSLRTDDIDGATPSPAFDPAKAPFAIMSVDDIDGAKPRIQRSLPNSNRQTNPLNPEYPLPSFTPPAAPVPRFLRDAFSNADIPGAHARSWKRPGPARDIMRIDDIAGAHPRKRVGSLLPSSMARMDVRDINNDGAFRSTRVTDPLNPVYVYDGKPCAAEDYGRAFYAPVKNVPTFSLQTGDIEKATADSATECYRTFRRPPEVGEEGEGPAPLLMVPSMEKQTAELENQEAVRKLRAERIWFHENRHLRGARGSGDPLQATLRQQRSPGPPERITLEPKPDP
jgi:hypothetical protein